MIPMIVLWKEARWVGRILCGFIKIDHAVEGFTGADPLVDGLTYRLSLCSIVASALPGGDCRSDNFDVSSVSARDELLKLVDAGLVVKLIDACYSGTLLVKGEWFPQNKDGFKNLISIASCLDTQTSLTGNPLSLFTEKFRAAALRKTEGPVFYTDIINTLRDEFIDNNSQTPFFVSQHTAREQFVDDASRLAALRKTLAEITTAATNRVQIAQEIVPATMTLLERLAAADAKVVKPDLMANFVGTFFDNLIKRVSTSEFAAPLRRKAAPLLSVATRMVQKGFVATGVSWLSS